MCNFSLYGGCLWLCLSLLACSERPQRRLTLLCLDKTEAQQEIIKDDFGQFFEKISPLEMAIQMQKPLGQLSGQPKEEFKRFWQQEVADFSPSEREKADASLQKALAYSLEVFPNLSLPDTIKLLKINGNAYGSHVFFTRNNSIAIPAAQLESKELYTVLIHELFHLYSRYNPKGKLRLFALIGFEKLPNLALNPMLQKRIFYNPDAVDCGYAIRLQDQAGKSAGYVPMIFSRFEDYDRANGLFFDHLEFRLFEISQRGDSAFILPDQTGHKPEDLRGFFEQTGKNTNYIIHPEEILADNFKLIILSKKAPRAQTADISPAGRELMKQIEQIILQTNK